YMLIFKKRDIVFIFVFICLLSLCYFFQTYLSKQERFNELSNELYTNHHAVFINKNDDDWLKNPLSKSSYRFFIEYTDTHRLLLDNSNNDWSPPIISGRFFSKTDEGTKAVVGKEMVNYIKEFEGKKYVSFEGKDYEVTGI